MSKVKTFDWVCRHCGRTKVMHLEAGTVKTVYLCGVYPWTSYNPIRRKTKRGAK